LEDYFGSNLTERRSYRPGSDRNSALNDLLSNRRLPIADTLREEQADRMNEFKAFYQLPSSTAPVGSPSPSANPIHDYNWQNAPRLPTATDLAPRKVADDYSRVTPNTAYFDKPDVKNRSVFGVDSSVPRSQALQSTSRRGSSVVLELPKRPGELTR
jgi:hypothetical protein